MDNSKLICELLELSHDEKVIRYLQILQMLGQGSPCKKIQDLDLRVRVFNPLLRAGLATVDQVISLTIDEMLVADASMNSKIVLELIDCLRKRGYTLKDDDGDHLIYLKLKVHTFNSLRRAGIKTITELRAFSEDDLRKLGLTENTVNEILTKIGEYKPNNTDKDKH